MKKKTFVITSSLVLLVSSLIYVVFSNNSRGQKELVFNKTVLLSNVKLDTKKTFFVEVYNPSNTDVKIAKIYTSCGCTRYLGDNAEDVIIKPKNKYSAQFEFDPASMHKVGDSIDHEIYILTTSPTETEYKIKLSGNII